tara:strand:+ start:190 stop:372 length:183 start_codon:yes stop_codon:yes gene_type:complete
LKENNYSRGTSSSLFLMNITKFISIDSVLVIASIPFLFLLQEGKIYLRFCEVQIEKIYLE